MLGLPSRSDLRCTLDARNGTRRILRIFIQVAHNNFGPKDFDRVVAFVENWPREMPLAIEFRHSSWYNDPSVCRKLCDLLETNKVTNIPGDTAGRRELMHMRLTTPMPFIRWVGANDPKSDRSRLDQWIERIAKWKRVGLKRLVFIVHQNDEQESPSLAAHFIKRLNKKIGTKLLIPNVSKRGEQHYFDLRATGQN